MKFRPFPRTVGSFLLSPILAAAALGHDSTTGEEHMHYDWSVKPPKFFLAQAEAASRTLPRQPIQAAAPAGQSAMAAAFQKFAPAVNVRWDEQFLFVESQGLPAHNMMVGITAWQQQVPLPQNYTGSNAWQIPLTPVPAKEPASIRNRFLRGAIALAVNGIPIFNPQNNRGEVSAEIGELDEWGGHCGRADDYHYHAAPLHLQSVLGKALPIAYALDGYPIYGLTEPDGSAPAGLDAFNGHTTAALGYHYHASTKYPFVNGGFHGEVVERNEQVDPQPRANSVREALPALRGAKITGFTTSPDGKERSLIYTVGGRPAAVNYADAGGGSWKFQFVSTDGSKHEETYQAHEGRGGRGGARPEGGRPPRGDDRGGPPQRREGEGTDRRGGPREDRASGRKGGPPFFEADFTGAKFIWSDDLALDNTVLFRTRIEKPGWTPHWNTKLELDVTGAALK